jgi:hypothetical protein
MSRRTEHADCFAVAVGKTGTDCMLELKNDRGAEHRTHPSPERFHATMFEPYSPDAPRTHRGAQNGLDDQLYGKLHDVNAALKDAGGVLIIVYALILLTAHLALWFGWYRAVPALKNIDLNNVWSYLIVFVVVFFVWIAHFEFLQWWCYRRQRPELLEEVQRAGVSRYQLLASLADDKSLAWLAEFLKRDRWDEVNHQFYVAGAR